MKFLDVNSSSQMEKYSKRFCFEDCDFTNGKILAESIFQIFQTASTEHAEILCVGFKDMIAKNLLWVTMRIKFEVLQKLEPNTEYQIITYPSGKNMLEFDRDYIIADKNEKMFVRGQSKWCLIDATKRRIAKMMDSPILTDCKPVFEEKFLKTETFKIEHLPDFCYEITPKDIDDNGHMNNTIYAKIIDEMLRSSKQSIKFLQINFLKEIMQNSNLEVYLKAQNNVVDFVGKICEGEQSFTARAIFENEV